LERLSLEWWVAWMWLKANNFRYKDDVIPHVDDIPLPQIIEENK
jgi:hypothetical protein